MVNKTVDEKDDEELVENDFKNFFNKNIANIIRQTGFSKLEFLAIYALFVVNITIEQKNELRVAEIEFSVSSLRNKA